MDRKILIVAAVAIIAILCASFLAVDQLSKPGGDDDDLVIENAGTYTDGTYDDVTIAPSVGDGTVILSGMTIEGDLLINGGGSQSIILQNSSVEGTTKINKSNGEIPRLLSDNSTTGRIVVESDAILESRNGSSYGDVEVTGSRLTVQGIDTIIRNVELKGEVGLDFTGGRIDSVKVDETVNITTNTQDSVESLPFQTTDPEGPGEVNVNDKPVEVEKVTETPSPDHGHTFTYNTTWPDVPGGDVTITGVCSCGSSTTSKHTPVEVSRTPSCESDGSVTYNVSYGEINSEHTYTIEKTGHDYAMEAEWNATHDGCSMTFTCRNDPTHVEVLDATVTKTVKSEHSCTSDGVTEYTATCELDGIQYTDIYTDTVPKHTYGDVVYQWTPDFTSATASTICEDCQDAITEQGVVDEPVVVNATCTTDGSRTHHATFATFGEDTEVVTIPKYGHDFEVSFTAGEQPGTYTYHAQCKNQCQEYRTGTVTVEPVKIDATYTEEGSVTYTPSVELDGTVYTGKPDVTAIPIIHEYGISEVLWDEMDRQTGEVTVILGCDRCDENVQGHTSRTTLVAEVSDGRDATCTEDGYMVLKVTYGDDERTKRYDFPATGHAYFPTFEWDEQGTTPSATFWAVCANNQTHVVSGEAAVTDTVLKEATCTEDGQVKYIATCTIEGTVYSTEDGNIQSSLIVTIPAFGHDYDVTFTWDAEYNAEYKAVCSNDSSHIHEGDATVTKTSMAETCTTPGECIYTATAVVDNKTFTDTKTRTGVAPGHDYRATFAWSDDLGYVDVTLSCTRSSDHTHTARVIPTVQDVPATCTEDGGKTYTATLTYEGETYTDVKVITNPKLGHDYTVTFQWDGYKAKYTAVCANDRAHDTSGDAVMSSADSATPDCENDGLRIHTATAVVDGRDYSDTRNETLESPGHAYGDVSYVWSMGNTAVTASKTCGTCDDVFSEQGTITSETTLEPSVGVAGNKRYTATFENFETTYKDVEIPALVGPTMFTVKVYGGTVALYGETSDKTEISVLEDTVVTVTPKGTVLYWSDSAGDYMPGSSFDILVNCNLYVTAHYENETAYGGWTSVKEPTCTDDGLRYRENPDTGNRMYEVLPSTGHDLGDLQVGTEPGCVTEGVGYRECADCHEDIPESIPANGHEYDNGTVTTEAVGSGEGTMTYECTECGHEDVRPYIKATFPTGDMAIDYRWVMAGTATPDSTCRYEKHTTWKVEGSDGMEHQAYLYYINKNVTDNYGDYRTDIDVMSWFLWIDYGDHSPVYVARTNEGSTYPAYGENNQYECNWGLAGYVDDMDGFIDFIDGLDLGMDNGRNSSTLFDMYTAYVDAYNRYGPDHFTADGTQEVAGRLCNNYYDDDWYYVVDENNCCLKLVSTDPYNTSEDIDYRQYRYNQYIKMDTRSPEPFSSGYLSGSIFNRIPTLATIEHLNVTFLDCETYHTSDFHHENGTTYYYNVENENDVFNWVIPEERYGYKFVGLQVKDLDDKWVDIPYAQYDHTGNPNPLGYGFALPGYDDTLKGLYEYMCEHPELGRFVSPHDPGFKGVFLRCVYAVAETDAHIELDGATFLDPSDDEWKSEGDVYSGYEYTIRAEVPEGKNFKEWTGTAGGSDISEEFDGCWEDLYYTMTEGDVTISAVFEDKESFDIRVETTRGGSFTGSSSGTYYMGDRLEWIAEPEQGFLFRGWYLNYTGIRIDGEDPYNEYGLGITDSIDCMMRVDRDAVVTAVFVPFGTCIDDYHTVTVENGFAYSADRNVYVSKILAAYNEDICLIENPDKNPVKAWVLTGPNNEPLPESPMFPEENDRFHVYFDTDVVGVVDVTYHTITYDTVGGSDVEADEFMDIERAIVTEAVPEKEGYDFQGWNTESDGSGDYYGTGSTIDLDGDVTLYAQWEKKMMKLLLRCNDALHVFTGDQNLYVRYGETVTIPTDVIEVYGSELKGWSYLMGERTVEVEIGGSVPYGIDDSGENMYYVDAIIGDYYDYVVHFEPGYDNPADTMSDLTFKTTDIVNGYVRFDNTLTRPYYEFDVWTCDNASVRTTDSSLNPISLIKTEEYAHGGEITLTATWEKLEYTIKYVKSDPIEGGTATGNGTSRTIRADETTFMDFTGIDCENHRRAGYSPVPKDTVVVYPYGLKVKTNDLLSDLVVDDSLIITLYPVWVVEDYTVGFEGSNETQAFRYDASATPLKSFSELGITTPDGMVFIGWCTDEERGRVDYTDGKQVKNLTTIGSITLYPVFAESTYTVHFFPDFGSNDHEEQVIQYNTDTALRANTFTMEGKVFDCWTTDPNRTTTFTDGQVVRNLTTTGDFSLYALWKDANNL
ncbi:MAG: InlB B-repeat-containing protein [Candidatus Methanomethylophilaceae archaeon]|nr:InlB B-repeat-containing protein [Candidatus Methanomethylophilaceae archaeon]